MGIQMHSGGGTFTIIIFFVLGMRQIQKNMIGLKSSWGEKSIEKKSFWG